MFFRFIAASSIAVLAATAADAPAPAPTAASAAPLTLAEALAQADRRSEQRTLAEARIAAALSLRRQALGLVLPNLTASGDAERLWYGKRPFTGEAHRDNGAEIALGMTLFSAQAWQAWRATGLEATASAADAAELRRQLAYDVTASFLTAIAADRELDAARRRRDVAAQTLSDTRRRVEVGAATPNDATRSELELADAGLAVTTAGQALLQARLSLADLVVAGDDLPPLAEPGDAELPSRDLAALEADGLRRRADLDAEALRIREDEKAASAQRLGYAPVVGVNGAWLAHSGDAAPGTPSPEWELGLSATWNLYDGGARAAAAGAIDAQRRAAEATLQADRRHLHRDLATQLGALATAESSEQQAARALDVARINADEVSRRFAQGVATALQRADANEQVFEAEVALVARRLDLASARFQLRRLIGQWPIAGTDAERSAEAARADQARSR